MFLAVRFVPLASATAIGFTSPVFAMLFAAIFLREHLTRQRWIAGCIGMAGALVIASPGAQSVSVASLIPVGAALFMGAEIVSIKWVSQTKDNAITIIFYSNLFGAILAFTLAAPVWIDPSPRQLVFLALLGSVAVAGQFCVLRGTRLAQASFIAPFFYASLVYAAILGYVFFSEVPTTHTIIGSVIILIGAFILAREDTPNNAPVGISLRKKGH
jgi:drug/metabolite transporter (DMT)-like permease